MDWQSRRSFQQLVDLRVPQEQSLAGDKIKTSIKTRTFTFIVTLQGPAVLNLRIIVNTRTLSVPVINSPTNVSHIPCTKSFGFGTFRDTIWHPYYFLFSLMSLSLFLLLLLLLSSTPFWSCFILSNSWNSRSRSCCFGSIWSRQVLTFPADSVIVSVHLCPPRPGIFDHQAQIAQEVELLLLCDMAFPKLQKQTKVSVHLAATTSIP